MDIKTYRDKMRACWLGKNVGGTLGAPFEGVRGVYDVEYYTHDISKGVLPNDDLDLQLVWLRAAEAYGRAVNSEILGEFWLSYIIADWSEYGAGKANMKFGLLPPYSGDYHNFFKNSNGAWIRSEIWACLAPGHPSVAVKYAYEDAIVDHSGEGVYAELFCAAIESAAFAESDTRTLIDIGLTYIPEDCMVAKCVKLAVECYDNGETWQEARKKVLKCAPGTFGLTKGYRNGMPEEDIPDGELGFDAPSNVGIVVIGWLYGEGDFSKSLCIAVGCGEDADCTAGTLGALLGIIGGCDSIDKKWLDPIGDEIKTLTIERTTGGFCSSVTKLAGKVERLVPTFIPSACSFDENGMLSLTPARNMRNGIEKTGNLEFTKRSSEYEMSPLFIKRENALFHVKLGLDGINIKEGEPKQVALKFRNKFYIQQWLKFKWFLPEDWTVSGGVESNMLLNQQTAGSCLSAGTYTITPNNLTKSKYEVVLEISVSGRPSKLYIPFVLMNEG